MMAQGFVFVHLLLLCVWCIDTKFQGVNAQSVTVSKVQLDDPEEGGTVDLRCNATNLESGNSLEWSRLYMNRNVIIRSHVGNSNDTMYTESSSEQGQYVVKVLKINVLRRDDAGTYYCTVRHSEGTVVETASIYLKVRYFPSAEYPLCSPNGPFTVQEGTTQQFTCATEKGSPPVSILIQKNGANIPIETWLVTDTTSTRSHNFTFTEDDNGTSVECKIISLPSFQRNCTFGPITVTMRDNRENQLPTTMENRPTPQTYATSEGSDTSYPTLMETTTSGSSQRTNLLISSQETSNPSNPSQEASNPSTPRQETSNPNPSQEASNPSTPSQETSNPSTPSQKTSNLQVSLPIVLIAVVVGGCILLLILILLLVVYCCFKKKPKSRQVQINLPLFQPTTDLVFEPQGNHLVVHQESTNLDKVDMPEEDISEEPGADQNPKPEVMSVSHSPNTEPGDEQSSSIKNGTGPSPTDVDKRNIKTFTPPDTGDSKEGQEEVLRPHEPHKSTPTTGETVYSEVSIQQRVPQVSSGYTTYADLDLPPCTSDTEHLPKDQTRYSGISIP